MKAHSDQLSERSLAELGAELAALWPGLDSDWVAGPYKVGCKSLFISDFSRKYKLPSTEQNTSTCLGGRPIAVRVWYPAEPDADSKPSPFQTYLSVPSADPSLQALTQVFNAFLVELASRMIMGKRSARMTSEEAANFQSVLQTSTNCYLNAPAIKDAFPALIYHAGLGGSIIDNSILLEFLASYGYVVATSAFPPEHGLSFGIDDDVSRSIKDISCVSNLLCRNYAVDPTRIGLLGHSFGGSAVLSCSAQAQMNARAVVSLDSTQEWHYDGEPPFTDVEKGESLTLPMMIFSMEQPNVSFDLYDAQIYCDRYYITAKHLQHNDFTSLEILCRTVSDGKTDQQTQLICSTHQAVCESVLAFLNTYLKEEAPNQAALSKRLKAINQNLQVLSIQTHQGKAAPISSKQLFEVLLDAERLDVIESSVAKASREIGPSLLIQVGRSLQEQGMQKDALLFYKALVQHLPDLSSAHEIIGDIYCYVLDDKIKGIEAYQAALDAIPRDSTLSERQRALQQRSLREELDAQATA